MKQTLLPYWLSTTVAEATAAISSAVNLRLLETDHLPAYTLKAEKIFITFKI
jgi:hypothetical protein